MFDIRIRTYWNIISILYFSILDEKKSNVIEGIQAKTQGDIDNLSMKYLQ